MSVGLVEGRKYANGQEGLSKHQDGVTEALSKSAKDGCQLCGLIAGALRAYNANNKYTIFIVRENEGRFFVALEHDVVAQFCFCLSDLSDNSLTVSTPTKETKLIWCKEDSTSAKWPYDRPKVVPNGFAYSEENTALIKSWVSRCLEHHNKCAIARSPKPLPKRVLDIGVSGDTVTLYVAKGEVEQYATLSYCWGTTIPLKTTAANFGSLCGGIALNDFPETLKESILVARSLGFRYIWIDALCIVQDDPLDWAEQASAMTDIYQQGALNICASYSHDNDSGLILSLSQYTSRVATYTKTSATSAFGHIYVVSGPCRDDHDSIFEFKTVSGCLWKRGWAFQENLVSPASVYYTYQGLEWGCRVVHGHDKRMESTVGFGHPAPDKTLKAIWADSAAAVVAVAAQSRPPMEKSTEYVSLPEWMGWVAYYSECNISFTSDKLPAVAGIASQLAQNLNISYLAGLWRENLPVGLTWTGRSQGSLVRQEGRAPSWSWASVDGPLDALWFLLPGSKYSEELWEYPGLDLEILEAVVKEVVPGSFGEVLSGRIEANG